MRSIRSRWLGFVLLVALTSAVNAQKTPSAQSGGNAPGMSGLSYPQSTWDSLQTPPTGPDTSNVALVCYRLVVTKSALQPFVLVPLKHLDLPAALRKKPVTHEDSVADAVAADQRRCTRAPLKMNQALVVAIDARSTPGRDRVQVLNLSVSTLAGLPINPTPVRPSFAGSSSTVQPGGGGIQALDVSLQQLLASPRAVSFTATQNGATPNARIVSLTSSSGIIEGLTTAVAYKSGSGWLTAQLSSTSTPATINVQPIQTKLSPRTYTARVTVNGTGLASQIVTVSYTVTGDLKTNRFVADTAVYYLRWPNRLPGDVIPTVSVNIVYTPAPTGAAWKPNTFYPAGSTVRPFRDSDAKHVFVTYSGGVSGSSPADPWFSKNPGIGDSVVESSVNASNKITWYYLDTVPQSVSSVLGAPGTDQVINLLTLPLPQSHTLSRFNLAAGVVYSTARNPTFALPSPPTAPAIATTDSEKKVSHNPTVDPVLMFTVYPSPIDAEADCTPLCLFHEAPGLSFGFSLASPTSNFYVGLSADVFRNVQLVAGAVWAKVTALPNPTVPILPASAPLTTQKYIQGWFVGTTLNISGFIQGLFGSGGGGGGGSGGKAAAPASSP